MAVNDKMARVFISHPSQVRCIKASEIKDGDKDLILNQFLKESEDINLGDIKEGFISFKDLKATSKIFKEGGFLEKIGVDGKDYANQGYPFFYKKSELDKIKGILEDDEKVCLHPVVRLCLTNISVNGNKETTDIVTFCGTTSTVSPVAKYEVTIGSNLEIMDSCDGNGFYDLLFKEFFNTFDYDKNLPNGFIRQANAEEFLWILNFQSKGEGCICNHWLTFKAKITGAGVTKDASNPISDFSPSLAVQGSIAHEKNCEPMEIFGDKEKKKSECDTLIDNVNKTIESTGSSQERAKILTKKNPELESEALAIINKEKERLDIIAFIDKLTDRKNCSSKQKQEISSKLVKNFAKQEKTHFQEWKEMLQAAVKDNPEDEEKFVTACVFDRSLVMESNLNYAKAIFKKEVGQSNIKGFFLDIAPFVQHASEEEYQKQAEELTNIIKNWWMTEEDEKVKAFTDEAQKSLDEAYEQLKEGILSKDDYSNEKRSLSMGIGELETVAENILKRNIKKKNEIKTQLLEKAFEIKKLNKENRFAKAFIEKNLILICKTFCEDA